LILVISRLVVSIPCPSLSRAYLSLGSLSAGYRCKSFSCGTGLSLSLSLIFNMVIALSELDQI
jgi:hypothetical protein